MTETDTFAGFAEEFLRFTGEIVWCSVATVDAKGRPRSRVLHPIREVVEGRPVGWAVTGKTPVKTAHLAGHPYVSCSYWSPAQNTVAADCRATWVDEDAAKRHVWDLFGSTPPPLGYDLSGFGAEGPGSPHFTPLQLDPWRVQILRFEGWGGNLTPRVWRAAGSR